jgi:hypothetical protein
MAYRLPLRSTEKATRTKSVPSTGFSMFYILFCLALYFFPDAATLQVNAMIMSVGVFAFLLCRLCFHGRSKS